MAKNDVIVKISQKQVAGTPGFGFPLIIVGGAETPAAYKECGSLDEVIEAGFTEGTAIYKQANALFAQNNKPSKVAVCSGQGKITETLDLLKDKDFRQVIIGATPIDPAGETIQEIARYIEESESHMLFVSTDENTLKELAGLDRTVAIIYGGGSEGVEGAIVGATAGQAVGSFTYKNIILKGITPDNYTDREIEEIHVAGGNCIVRKAGDIVTSEGKTTSGEYIDVIDGRDYIIRNIAYQSQKLLNTSPRLSFDNAGISQLEGVVTNILAQAFSTGIIGAGDDGSPQYATDFATRAEVSAEDRKLRTYNGGKFSYSPSEAVHYATINGTIEV